MSPIDLNADVGERSGCTALAEDSAILDAVTSASVACAFHAGDPHTMRLICEAAIARGVRIGAHVGYDDRPGFGRRERDVEPARLRDEAIYQLGALGACAAAAGGRVSYLKPHGALYARCETDAPAAAALADAAASLGWSLAILGPPGSQLLAAAAARGLAAVAEGFADRAYDARGRLVPRREPGGGVLSSTAAIAQAEQIAAAGRAVAVDGSTVALDVRSICLHSDTPGAADLARALRACLERAGLEIRAFT